MNQLRKSRRSLHPMFPVARENGFQMQTRISKLFCNLFECQEPCEGSLMAIPTSSVKRNEKTD